MAWATKLPFHLPLQHYLGDRRLWAMVEEHVDDARVRRRGFVRPEYVRNVKQRAQRGDFLAAKQLFALVILEIWHRVFVDAEAA